MRHKSRACGSREGNSSWCTDVKMLRAAEAVLGSKPTSETRLSIQVAQRCTFSTHEKEDAKSDSRMFGTGDLRDRAMVCVHV